MPTTELTPAEARAQWVTALRSGEYEQVRGALRTDEGYCCLGVACDLYAQSHPDAYWKGSLFRTDPDNGSAVSLPPAVRDWLGLTDPDGDYMSADSLAGDNDYGATFAEIADTIEAAPEGLIARHATP